MVSFQVRFAKAHPISGGVAERLKAAVLKTVGRASVPWVQILPPPPVMRRTASAVLLITGVRRPARWGARGPAPGRRQAAPGLAGNAPPGRFPGARPPASRWATRPGGSSHYWRSSPRALGRTGPCPWAHATALATSRLSITASLLRWICYNLLAHRSFALGLSRCAAR